MAGMCGEDSIDGWMDGWMDERERKGICMFVCLGSCTRKGCRVSM